MQLKTGWMSALACYHQLRFSISLASTSSAKASASRSLPRAILHADKMTDPMQRAIDETDTRREKQVF